VVLKAMALLTPVPRRLMVCGLVGALSVTVIVPVCSCSSAKILRWQQSW
jgi:hypothetical protein